MKKIILMCMLLMSSLNAYAAGHGKDGGDPWEVKFENIRGDILNWIKEGHAKKLNFTEEVSYEIYSESMIKLLEDKNVLVTFTHDQSKVMSYGKAKTCVNFYDFRYNIVCHIARFKEAEGLDRARLVHHEFAVLARLEVGNRAESNYDFTSQIMDFKIDNANTALAEENKPNEYINICGLGPIAVKAMEWVEEDDCRKVSVDKLSSVAYLYIKNYKVKEIPNNIFKKLKLESLQYFTCTNCEISKIYDNSFAGLDKLSNLGLVGNKITEISNTSLLAMPELSDLRLDNNLIEYIDKNDFKGLNQLRFVRLANNHITGVHRMALSRPPLLKSVDLSANKIEDYMVSAAYFNNRMLGYVDLRGNKISAEKQKEIYKFIKENSYNEIDYD